tara:strand:+ start:423 stop:605 length:183 start_codon:yes stop_codon:yes gene_type:complete
MNVKHIKEPKIIIQNGWLKIARNINKVKRKKFFVRVWDFFSSNKLKKNIKAIDVKKKVKM